MQKNPFFSEKKLKLWELLEIPKCSSTFVRTNTSLVLKIIISWPVLTNQQKREELGWFLQLYEKTKTNSSHESVRTNWHWIKKLPIGNKFRWRRRFWWSNVFTQLQTDKLLASCGWRVSNGNFCLNAKWALELHDWNHHCDIRYIPRSRVISCRHQCRAVIRDRNCIHSKELQVTRGN